MGKSHIIKYLRIILIIILIFFCSYKENEFNSPALAGDIIILHYNEYIGFVNQVKGLNLRVKASKESAVLTLLPLFTEVLILDNNGPLDKVTSKSGKDISGKWVKVKVNNNTGWVFSPYLTILNNSQNKRLKPNFNKVKLKSNSITICCDCGPYSNEEEISISNGAVFYSRIHGCEETEKFIQEGTYSINNNTITIQLRDGKLFYNYGDGSGFKSTTKKAPAKTISIEWNEELQGFITSNLNKYLKNDNYIVNINNAQIVSLHGFIFADLCHKVDYQDFKDCSENYYKIKKNDSEMIMGYFYEVYK